MTELTSGFDNWMRDMAVDMLLDWVLVPALVIIFGVLAVALLLARHNVEEADSNDG